MSQKSAVGNAKKKGTSGSTSASVQDASVSNPPTNTTKNTPPEKGDAKIARSSSANAPAVKTNPKFQDSAIISAYSSTSNNSNTPLSLYNNPESLVKESTGNFMLDRSLWLLLNLVGKQVEVQVRSGEVYEGIFHSSNVGGIPGSSEKNFGVVLKMARKKDPQETANSKKQSKRPLDTLIINPIDFVQLFAKEVGVDIRNERDFATDSEISSAFGQMKERELQKWVPDANIPQDLQWDEEHVQHWDQFAQTKKSLELKVLGMKNFIQQNLNQKMLKKWAKKLNKWLKRWKGDQELRIFILQKKEELN